MNFSALSLRPYNETAFGMFLANDFNGDGIITRLELETSFDKYDANGKCCLCNSWWNDGEHFVNTVRWHCFIIWLKVANAGK